LNELLDGSLGLADKFAKTGDVRRGDILAVSDDLIQGTDQFDLVVGAAIKDGLNCSCKSFAI
jgi:hypothetical protein